MVLSEFLRLVDILRVAVAVLAVILAQVATVAVEVEQVWPAP
jgi:hypothetical protein